MGLFQFEPLSESEKQSVKKHQRNQWKLGLCVAAAMLLIALLAGGVRYMQEWLAINNACGLWVLESDYQDGYDESDGVLLIEKGVLTIDGAQYGKLKKRNGYFVVVKEDGMENRHLFLKVSGDRLVYTHPGKPGKTLENLLFTSSPPVRDHYIRHTGD
jgi:hypothetical protein